MSLYLKQIEQLVALQKVDDAIFAVKNELNLAPKELESLEGQYRVIETQRNRVLEKIDHIKEQQKRIGLEIDDDTVRIKKSKNKLMQVNNQREYHAMMREMDNMEKQNRNREEEKLVLAEELENQEQALKDIDGDYLALKAELEVKSEGLQTRMNEAKIKLDGLQGTRSTTGSIVPPAVFQRYEFIRKRLDHPVIVSVNNGVCTGCHIAIPPQSFIELQRGQQILSCPNCQRLIYWCEHFTNPDDVKIEPKTQVIFKED